MTNNGEKISGQPQRSHENLKSQKTLLFSRIQETSAFWKRHPLHLENSGVKMICYNFGIGQSTYQFLLQAKKLEKGFSSFLSNKRVIKPSFWFEIPHFFVIYIGSYSILLSLYISNKVSFCYSIFSSFLPLPSIKIGKLDFISSLQFPTESPTELLFLCFLVGNIFSLFLRDSTLKTFSPFP